MEHTGFGIRLLRADEIECRVAVVNAKGVSLLLFKDARVDQKILDETFTPFGWKRSHQLIDGSLYCTVEVWDKEKGQWISKQDVGTMSYSEKEKGQASDSFKRACFNWGLGRELYTAPFIWVPAEKVKITEKEGGRYFCSERFSVQSIAYNDDREICSLSIVNSAGYEVYSMGEKGRAGKQGGNLDKKQTGGTKTVVGTKPAKSQGEELQRHLNASQIKRMESELDRTGVALGTVLSRYHIEDMDQMTEDIYKKAMECLAKSRDKRGLGRTAA